MARFRRFDEVRARTESFDPVRARREEMLDAILALESALARAAPGRVDEWREEVRDALGTLRDEVTEHIAATEEPDGFLAQIVADAPHLSQKAKRLRVDHELMIDTLAEVTRYLDQGPGDDADRWVTEVRRRFTELLGLLVRHRQAGADVIYEAYNYDIGGED